LNSKKNGEKYLNVKDLKDALDTVGISEESLLEDQLQANGLNGERRMSLHDFSKVIKNLAFNF